MKHLVNMGLLWTCFFGLFSYAPAHAQCTLACNDLVQVSIPSEGFAVVLPDMVLEGDSTSCPGPKTVNIDLPNGQSIGDTVTCEYVQNVLDVMVIDDITGNFCWGSILVEDKLKPIISCQDTSVNCTADLHPDSIGLVMVTDNCDPDPALSMTEIFTPQSCATPLTQTLTRTWNATDGSGNSALPCVQTISIVRPSLSDVVFPPNFDNTDTLALPCENPDTSIAHTGFPMVDSIPIGELCKITAVYEDLVIFNCENEYSVLREWTVLDCCSGEILTHTQHIKVMDATAPALTCPPPLTVSANGPDCDGFFLLPPAEATDNCSAEIGFRTLIPGYFGEETNGGLVYGLPLGTYILTYKAIDQCLNQSECEVELTVADDVPPTAICDEITTVSLSSQGLANVAAAVFDDGSHDACCGVNFLAKRMDEPSSPFAQNVLFDCEDVGQTVMVIVQVSDCEGNANTCMVEVNPEDKIPPHITCPPDVTLTCSEWAASPNVFTGEPFVQENCAIDTIYFQDFENLNPCHVGTIDRTFTVVDGSGYSGNCSQTITTIDTTEARYFFPADTMVDCSQPLDSISAGQVFALADCEYIGLNVDDEIFPLDCGLKIFRTYTFLDWCSGFDTSYTQTIVVIDTNPPLWDIPFGSLDTAFTCPGDLVKPPDPTATDFCSPPGSVTVTLDFDTTVYFGCPNKYERTLIFGAVDTCGNVAEPFVITLIVNDTLGPNPFIPDAGPFQCVEDIPPFNPATIPAEDNCFGGVTIDLVGTAYDTTGCSGSIIRTYLLTDVCGLDTLATQAFPFNDTIPPVATDTVLGPVPCFSDIPGPLMSPPPATDNCGGAVTSEFISDVTIDSSACGGQVNRRWKLIDGCGNFSVVTQTILVNDTIAPTVNCPPDLNLTITEDSICSLNLILIVTGVDNCGGPVIMSNNMMGVTDTLFSSFPVGNTEVVFYASDQCGNMDSCSMSVNITETRPPGNFCNDFDQFMDPDGLTEINVDSLLAAGTFGGEDFCTEVTFDFSPGIVSCDNFTTEPTPIPYTLTVTDAFGNMSSCGNTMFLYDPFDACDDGLSVPVVAGRAKMHTGEAMEGLEIQLIDGGGVSLAQTGEHGLFFFDNIAPGSSCSLAPYKNDDHLNGVSTFDILLITKHILGQEFLQNPYHLIAADVNASGGISTFDILALRKMVLHVSDEFPGNTSWRFIPADYVFPDPTDPFSEDFPESTWLSNVTGDELAKNFIGVKVGDVNGSASPNFWGGNIEDRSAGEFALSANNLVLEKGTGLRVPILAEGGNILSAIQATVEYDVAKMKFRGITPAVMSIEEHDYAEVGPGLVTLSWFDVDPVSIQPGDALFYLQFDVLEKTPLTGTLSINSLKTPAIAYEDGGNPLNISWRIHAAPTVPVDDAVFFELAQNRPNPFAHQTTIGFRLGENMPARLELIDLSGRVQKVMEKELSAGWHEVELGSGFFHGSGIYICRLVTPHGAAQRRMVYK